MKTSLLYSMNNEFYDCDVKHDFRNDGVPGVVEKQSRDDLFESLGGLGDDVGIKGTCVITGLHVKNFIPDSDSYDN